MNAHYLCECDQCGEIYPNYELIEGLCPTCLDCNEEEYDNEGEDNEEE